MRMEGRTDMTKLIVPVRNIAKAPKNVGLLFIMAIPLCSSKYTYFTV